MVPMMPTGKTVAGLALGALCAWPLVPSGATAPEAAAQGNTVRLLRVPNDGIQPVAQVSAGGTLHLIYFAGDPSAGDVFYILQRAGSDAWSSPIRVNSEPGSVIAIGTVRGAHMALGSDGRVHVAWMGSAAAQPRGPDNQSPMLYARLTDAGNRFEAQRNVVTHAFGLDGGGTVVADNRGRVFVLWHADAKQGGEEHRRVWMTTSMDGGTTFAPEVAVSDAGVCGCCGMNAAVEPNGSVRVLYRAFRPPNHRDMYLLTIDGSRSERQLLETWRIGACPMSTSSTAVASGRLAVAWETDAEVSWATLDREASAMSAAVQPPGRGGHRKHPGIALAGDEQIMFVWTEGMAWSRGGTLHWQEYDHQGNPTQVSGATDCVPVWSRPAVVANGDGLFTILF